MRDGLRFVSLIALGLSAMVAAAAAGTGRVTLLSAVDRASVVVALDEAVRLPALHMPDDRTVALEIGPVKAKVANELLQAAAASPLVDHVVVRGITRGRQGTLIALQIVGKTTLSASVRRASQRIYVDLEPRSTTTNAAVSTETDVRSRRATIARPVEHARSSNAPANARTTERGPNSPVAQMGTNGARQIPAATALQSVPGVARSSTRQPEVAAGLDPLAIARTEATTALGPQDASLGANVERLSTDARQVNRTTQVAVRESQTAWPAPVADARLPMPAGPSSPASAAPLPVGAPDTASASDFSEGMRALRPDFERVTGKVVALKASTPLGAELPGQIESVLTRLRALSPPGELVVSHERACTALSALLSGWVQDRNGAWVAGTNRYPSVLKGMQEAVADYLKAFNQFDRPARPTTTLPANTR